VSHVAVKNVAADPAAVSPPLAWKTAGLSLLLALPIPFLAESSGLDVYIENFYYDPVARTFPWRHVMWFETLAHSGLRTMLVLVAAVILVALLISLVAPAYLRGLLPRGWNERRVLVYLLLATLLGPLLVGLLKDLTVRPCPWSLSMYGGEARYFDLWQVPLFNPSAPGRCFPGAHASAGFSLLAFVPLLMGRARLFMLLFALAVGMVMGWTRMMQGAHFLSHNLWSAWICWACVLLVYGLVRPLGKAAVAETAESSEAEASA
jgi:membrane-associated PAP2 superfamily phosphatase